MIPLADVSGVRAVHVGEQSPRFMWAGEREMLVSLACHVGAETMIEVGVQEGHTACQLLAHVPTLRRYVGVDVSRDYAPKIAVQRAEIPDEPGHLVAYDSRFELIVRSRGSLDLSTADLPLCDVFLVDGDHSREAVLHDSELARLATRPGGVIVWHDYSPRAATGEFDGLAWGDVYSAMEHLRASGRDVRHVDGTHFAVEFV